MTDLTQKMIDQKHINKLWEETISSPNDVEVRHKLWSEVRKYNKNYDEKFPFNYKHGSKEK